MLLRDKVAIITGAGRGLGRASAAAMAGQGAAVVIVSRTPAELTETAGLVESAGGRSLALKADVSREEEIAEVVDETLSVFGRIDILMNNAAVIGPVSILTEVDDLDWEQTISVNLNGPFMFCRAVVPHMTGRGSGKIVNVTSGLGRIVMPPFGAYSVSKAGLDHLTRFLAEELRADNIQVNGLDPGIMDTRMHETIRGMGPEILGEALYHQFMSFKEEGHLSPPDEVAKLALWLVSPASDTVTGEIGGVQEYMAYGYGLDSGGDR